MCYVSILPAFAKVLLSNPIGTHFSIAYNVCLDVDVSDTTMAVLGQINIHFFLHPIKKGPAICHVYGSISHINWSN